MRVLIIGGTSGIGLALALHYLQQGDEVAVCGRDLARLPAGLMEQHPRLQAFPLDISDRPALAQLVDQFAVAAQVAVSGLGVALLPTLLIEAELARGDLVPAVDIPMESAENYYLAWRIERESYPPLASFRRWIQAEVTNDAA